MATAVCYSCQSAFDAGSNEQANESKPVCPNCGPHGPSDNPHAVGLRHGRDGIKFHNEWTYQTDRDRYAAGYEMGKALRPR